MLAFGVRACIGRFGRLLGRLREKLLKIRIVHIPEQTIKFHFAEAGAAQIHIQRLQCIHFGAEHIIIPRGCFRHLVVCNAVCLDLRVRQVIDPDAGHFVHAQPFCGLIAGVSGNDGSFPINQDGHPEAKLFDALGHRLNGSFVVSGVVLIGMDLRNILIHYLLIHFFSLLCFPRWRGGTNWGAAVSFLLSGHKNTRPVAKPGGQCAMIRILRYHCTTFAVTRP